jgi:DNA-binding winged helix-turn-helix (wHTH) protein
MQGYPSGTIAREGAGAWRPIHLAREPHFRLGGMLVKPSLLEVGFAGRRQTLQPRVMQVLVALARSGGEVVSRDMLIETCWAGRIVGEDAINRCIGRLRRLAESSEGAFAIDTVARVGYRLSAPAVAGAASDGRPPASRWSLRAALLLAAAALLVAGRAAFGLGAATQTR